VSEKMDHDVEIDVWIPDPYATRAMRAWPRLHGVKLVLSMMAGTEWIPGTVGPHVTICNAHGAHNISTAEWTLAAILAMLKYFPLYLDIQKSGVWKRRFEASAHYARDHRRHAAVPSRGDAGGVDGKDGAAGGVRGDRQEIERMLAPFNVKMLRVARSARTAPEVHAVSELEQLLPQAEVVVLILPSTAETKGLIGQAAACLDAARGAAGECRTRADCGYRCAGGGAPTGADSRRA
jgi:phosphoglycerate dehydrogenase-like enzyme